MLTQGPMFARRVKGGLPRASVAALVAALALAGSAGFAAAGATPLAPLAATPDLPVVAVADGCGPGFFRTLAGQCFPNRRFVGPYGGVHAPPPCPPGYLRAPDRPLCYPVGR
jgi:hypothetical protein